MNRDELPNTAFIDPAGENLAAVRALAERVLELVLEAAASAAARPPMPHVPTLEGIPTDVPDAPLAEDQLLAHLTSLIRGSMNPAHPGCLGHMDAMPTTVSVLGDLVAAAVNNNLLSLEMSPLFSRLEDRWDELNTHLQARLLREAEVFLSLPLFRGGRWLRLVLLNPYTDERTLDRLFHTIDSAFAAT